MEKVVQLYHRFLDLPNITGFATITNLKEFYSQKTTEREEFEIALENYRESVDGNREAVEELKEIAANIVELETMEDVAFSKVEEIDSLVFEQTVLIISNNDEEFATVCKYLSLMDEVYSYSEGMLYEIDDVVEEFDSDIVDNINDLFIGYRDFLDNISKSITDLHDDDYNLFGSDYDFTNVLSSDFWGNDIQSKELDQAKDEMNSLRETIIDIIDDVSKEYTTTMNSIQARVDMEWEEK